MPKHGTKAKRWRAKETRAPVLYSEYEPCLEAMERKRWKGVEVEEEEGEKSIERERERRVLGVYLVPVVDGSSAGTGCHEQ